MDFEKGSFRDPAGKIFYKSKRVFRKINKPGINRINFLIDNDLINKSINSQFLVESHIVDKDELKKLNIDENFLIVEHERIPYISYPYEWSFQQLKAAAIHHLSFHIFLLNNNATLIDASAYNIQFIGFKPIFIDLMSIKKYEEGEFLYGHKQFCENFLNPLILSSKKSIQFNNWFKGNLEGIQTNDLDNLLSFFDKFSYNIFVHVYLLNKIDKKFKPQNKKLDFNKQNKFSKKSLLSMLLQLKSYINKLEPKKSSSKWANYSAQNSYEYKEEISKINIVSDFVKKNKFSKIADLGCNDGIYSRAALKNGCEYVVGFDYDFNSINRAYSFAKKEKSNFLPLIFDATNPSANIGWNETERKSFNSRLNFDGVLALAFEHHLSIAKNIPLQDTINWIVSLAPKGLIEFVPKNDETIQKMIKFKGDIFPNYNEENFLKFLSKVSKIFSVNQISKSGRKIFEFERL